MAKSRSFDHPDGPNNVVSIVNTRRGRWRCQDVVDTEPVYSSTSGTCIDRPRDEVLARTVTMPVSEDGPQHHHSRRYAGNGAEEQKAKAEAVRAEDDDNPTTSDLTLDLDLKKNLELPGSLDTNSNASPRKTTSTTLITNHSTARDTEVTTEETGDSVNRTELLAVTLVVCIVLLPCLLPFWSVSGDSWNILHILWRMVFQAIAVAFSTGLVLLGLQVHFPSYQLRLWVARVFHLEIKEETTPQTGPVEKLHQTEKEQVECPPQIGDGDKKSDILSSGEPHADEPQKESTNDITGQTTDEQDGTPETECVPHAQNVNEAKEETQGTTERTVQTVDPEKRHKQALRRFHRKFLHIRRKYKYEMWKLKRTDHEASEVLSRVQLALPALEREKQALLAELEAIHKQHQEEKRRNQDLITRLHRLNQQFMRVGAPPQASATSSSSISVGHSATEQPHHHQQHYDPQRPQPYHPPQQHQQQHHHLQQREQQNQHHQHQQPQQQQQQTRLPATGQKDVGMETKTDAATSGSAARNAPRSTVCGATTLSYSVALCSQPASAQFALRPFQQQPK